MELGLDLKLLVFDLDGTLVHLDVDWAGLRMRLGLDDRESLGEAIQRLALAGDPLTETVTELELAGLGNRTVAQGVADLLEHLGRSHQLAVLTRNSHRAARRALANVAASDQIFVVGREQCPMLKPAPDGLNLILAEFGVAPEQAAMIGDTDHDVRAARAARVHSVVVRNDRLAHAPEGADHYVDRLDDLPSLLRPPGKADL